jgi:hypothetical protein
MEKIVSGIVLYIQAAVIHNVKRDKGEWNYFIENKSVKKFIYLLIMSQGLSVGLTNNRCSDINLVLNEIIILVHG